MTDLPDATEIFRSIFSLVPAFVYRCRNDKEYTMLFMSGQVAEVCGHQPCDIINNAKVSFVGLTHPDDKELAFAQVDAAIAKRQPWDFLYRLLRLDGGYVWIRERGAAVFGTGGELLYLQGLIVLAQSEVDLRDKIVEMADRTKQVNTDILRLAETMIRTNKHLSILSINAGIEAARAGQAGAGMAVIAKEIKLQVEANAACVSQIAERMR